MKKSQSSIKFTAWIVLCIIYAIDCLIITPIGLTICKTCDETGLMAGFFYDYIGMFAFPLMFIFVSGMFWLFLGFLTLCFKNKNSQILSYGITIGTVASSFIPLYLNNILVVLEYLSANSLA